MEPLSTSMASSVKRLGTVTSDSFTDLREVTGFLGSSTGGSWYSSPSLSAWFLPSLSSI